MVIWAPVGDVSVLVGAFSKTMAAPTPTTAPEEEVEIYTPDNFKNVWRYFWFPKIPGEITDKDKVLCKIRQ